MTDMQVKADQVAGRNTGATSVNSPVFQVRRPSLQSAEGSQSEQFNEPDLAPEASAADTTPEDAPPPTQFRIYRRHAEPHELEAKQASPALSLVERPEPRVHEAVRTSVARSIDRVAYIAGTFDTKGLELNFIKSRLDAVGLRTVTVDLGTSERPSGADVGPREVARHHPDGADTVFTGVRGTAVAAMAEAFAHFLVEQRDLGGVISAGGSGATALATPAMQRLDVGVPKVMVSTVASGDVKAYVGPTDICMM